MRERFWGRGLRNTAPYPLPQTPTPNPLYGGEISFHGIKRGGTLDALFEHLPGITEKILANRQETEVKRERELSKTTPGIYHVPDTFDYKHLED